MSFVAVPSGLAIALVLSGCPKADGEPPAGPGRVVTPHGVFELTGARSWSSAAQLLGQQQDAKVQTLGETLGAGAAFSADLDGRMRLAWVAPELSVAPGKAIQGVLGFEVTDSLGARPDLKVFVHAVAPGGQMPLVQADHPLLDGKVKAETLRPGDLVVDTYRIKLRSEIPTDQAELRVGLYEGKNRWPVDEGPNDGTNRVRASKLKIPGGGPAFPTAVAMKRQGAIKIDGVLDEADWQSAAKLGPFIKYNGRTNLRSPTTAHIVWDETHLYVAFVCENDPDVHTPYKKRDDPLYNSEAVEIFIDADGDKDVYVELQAAPNDLQFDAAFEGGARKGFDTSWNAKYETKATVEGTLNDPSDKDKRWVSEWKIEIASLKDIPRPPQAGDKWKINLFRLDRTRKGGRVVRSEASAWSSPYSGDFHNLERFGTLEFAP